MLFRSVQTLALIAHAREQDPQAPPFLVVAPASVLPVWRREAERFTPGLDVRVLDRTGRARGTALSEAVRGADVVVTSGHPFDWNGEVRAVFLNGKRVR